MTPKDLKKALRSQVRKVVASIDAGQKASASAVIEARITRDQRWQSARSVLLFSPLDDEPALGNLIARGLMESKTICLPRYRESTNDYQAAVIQDAQKDLTSGKFGVPEPADHCALHPLNQLDLVLVPGVAFAACGSRLGRGKGYYDRILKTVSGLKLGVAFDEQIVNAIPSEEHDVRVDGIVTPTRWMD